MTKYGKPWLELALEIVRAANEKMTLSSFLAFQKLALPQAGKGFRDRQRVLKVILDLKIVQEIDGMLVLGSPSMPNWLSDSLLEGDETAWGIVQEIDPKGILVRKFDDENLKKIGEIGELAVIAELKNLIPADLHNKIQKVSDTDDSAGYDVLAPNDRLDNYWKLEVKTTSRPISESFTFFLSRNEAHVSRQASNWYLVATQVFNEQISILGHANYETLKKYLPTDPNPDSEWQSVRITIQKFELASGLPMLSF